jgi:hypothetical protein
MYENFVKPTIKYCEDNLPSYIAQPANAWSNLIFVFVGIYIFLKSREHKNPLLKFLGPMAVLVGIFSFFYHASFTFIGQFLDLGSMYLLSSYLIILNLRRFNRQSFTTKKLICIFLLLLSASLLATYFIRPTNNFSIGYPIFALHVLAILILEWRVYKRRVVDYKIHNLLITFAIFISAFVVLILDLLKIWCDPSTFHLINDHALWHILNSISFLFIYFFYRQFD